MPNKIVKSVKRLTNMEHQIIKILPAKVDNMTLQNN